MQELFRNVIISPLKDIDVVGLNFDNSSYYMENSTSIYAFTQQVLYILFSHMLKEF